MDDVTVNEWHSYAKSWAKHAGSMMMEARQKASFDREYKTGHELVTSIDIAIDEYLCENIRQTFPDHLILSEESSPDLAFAQGASVPVWVIDPIDARSILRKVYCMWQCPLRYITKVSVGWGLCMLPSYRRPTRQ